MNDDALSKMYSKTMPEKIFGHNFEMTCFKITIRYKKNDDKVLHLTSNHCTEKIGRKVMMKVQNSPHQKER
jgi:hypothetical protein